MTPKRYTSEEMRAMAQQQQNDSGWYEDRGKTRSQHKCLRAAEMLRQASETECAMESLKKNSSEIIVSLANELAATEAKVMGLVEQAYREGFRDGMVDSVADESGIGGIGEDAYWSGSNAREALSKFRGGENEAL